MEKRWAENKIGVILAIILVITAAIFALPIVIYCVIAQAIFVGAIFILDAILPDALTIVGVDLFFGFLDTGIGAAIGFFLMLGRWIINFLKIEPIFWIANIIFLMVSIDAAVRDYGSNVHSAAGFISSQWRSTTDTDFVIDVVLLSLLGMSIIGLVLGFIDASKPTGNTGNVNPSSSVRHVSEPPALQPNRQPESETYYQRIARENAAAARGYRA